jgi:hypothetical protein
MTSCFFFFLLYQISHSAEFKTVDSLPKAVLESVKKWNPKFEIFKQTDFSSQIQKMYPLRSPSIITGDFNGDKVDDYALLGSTSENEQAVVAVLSDKKNPKSWTTMVIETTDIKDIKNSDIPADDKGEKGIPVYLTLGAGSLADDYKRIHKENVIQVEAYGGSVEQFVIENSKPLRLVPKGN